MSGRSSWMVNSHGRVEGIRLDINNLRDFEELPMPRRGDVQHVFGRHGWLDLILPHDVRQRQDMTRWLNPVGWHALELLHVLEDFVELRGKSMELCVLQLQAGEPGGLLDLFGAYDSHLVVESVNVNLSQPFS